MKKNFSNPVHTVRGSNILQHNWAFYFWQQLYFCKRKIRRKLASGSIKIENHVKLLLYPSINKPDASQYGLGALFMFIF